MKLELSNQIKNLLKEERNVLERILYNGEPGKDATRVRISLCEILKDSIGPVHVGCIVNPSAKKNKNKKILFKRLKSLEGLLNLGVIASFTPLLLSIVCLFFKVKFGVLVTLFLSGVIFTFLTGVLFGYYFYLLSATTVRHPHVATFTLDGENVVVHMKDNESFYGTKNVIEYSFTFSGDRIINPPKNLLFNFLTILG